MLGPLIIVAALLVLIAWSNFSHRLTPRNETLEQKVERKSNDGLDSSLRRATYGPAVRDAALIFIGFITLSGMTYSQGMVQLGWPHIYAEVVLVMIMFAGLVLMIWRILHAAFRYSHGEGLGLVAVVGILVAAALYGGMGKDLLDLAGIMVGSFVENIHHQIGLTIIVSIIVAACVGVFVNTKYGERFQKKSSDADAFLQ